MKNLFVPIVFAAATFLAPSAALALERSGFFELPNPLPSGTGNPNFSFDSAGSLPTFVNPTPGEYVVTFPGLAHGFGIGEGGDVQVSSHQPFMHCNPIAWVPAGADLQVTVDCFNRFGGRDNAQFVVAYRQMVLPVNVPGTLRAYVWSPSSTAPITVNSVYSFNSMGATNSIQQLGTGFYRVTMPQMFSSAKGGNVIVSSYGTENGQMRWCKVGSWFSLGGTTLGVDVFCFAPGGAAANSRFTAFYGLNTADKIGSSAYVWSENASPPANFTPDLFYQAVLANRSSNTAVYSPSLVPSGNIVLNHLNVGLYKVTVPRLNALGTTNVLVTAYGSENPNHCWISHWEPSGSNQDITIGCGDLFDSMADTRFALEFGTSQSFFF